MQTNPLAMFGDHLARLRKARGWSQEKLALESGLARSYVSGIERGRRNVALVNICVLADTLGVPTSEMLRFTPPAIGAQDGAAPSGRTPLPQISRSLCKLENRDQVWLAEIIRSLSSRLSHVAPPGASGTGSSPFVNSQTDNDADIGLEGSDQANEIDDVEGAGPVHALGEIEEVDEADEADEADNGLAHGVVIDPGFGTRHTAHRPLTPSLDGACQRIGNHADNNASISTTSASPVPLRDPDTSDGALPGALHDGRSLDIPAVTPLPAAPARSDALSRDDARRYPAVDDE